MKVSKSDEAQSLNLQKDALIESGVKKKDFIKICIKEDMITGKALIIF